MSVLLLAAIVLATAVCPAMFWWRQRRGAAASCCAPGRRHAHARSELAEVRRRQRALHAALAVHADASDHRPRDRASVGKRSP